MTRNKHYNNPQDQNGFQGETRSKAILSKRFRVYEASSDVNGTDLMAEIIPSSQYEYEHYKKNVKVFGLVQSKYFQKGTTLRIDADYIEDDEGPIPNFFVLLHTTDEDENSHCYFFTADQIKNKLPLKRHKNQGLYYNFSLTKRRTYSEHFDIPDMKINEAIFQAITKTAELRLQAIISRVDNEWIKPGKRTRNSDEEFRKSIAGLHLVDKLWKASHYYKEFRHMLPWRLVEKISYANKFTEQTFYHNFTLKTTNRDIEAFFNSISVADKVEITNEQFFKGVQHPQRKSQEIVSRLNDSQIFFFLGAGDKKKSIRMSDCSECNCVKCQYESLNFSGAYEAACKISKQSTESYDLLLSASLFFQLHLYGKDRGVLEKLIDATKLSQDYVPYFLALYNLEIAQRYDLVENTVDLYFEQLKLPLQEEKKQILKSIGDRSLLNSFKETIDKLYLTVKDYKERRENISTGPSIESLYGKVTELYFFYRENHCFITDEFETIFEKYIECCCISYSLQNQFRSHVKSFTELEITLMLLYCRPEKLLQFIQRNDIGEIKCTAEAESHFLKSFENFFSEKNVRFLDSHMRFTENRTQNPDLRRKITMLFNNLCYMATYLDVPLKRQNMDMLIDFVKRTDFSGYEISTISFVVLQKSDLFTDNAFAALLEATFREKDEVSYLPTNIAAVMAGRNHVVEDDPLIIRLSKMALKSRSNLLPWLFKILTPTRQNVLRNQVVESLALGFNTDLFAEVLLNDLIDNPVQFFHQYNLAISSLLTKSRYVVFDHNSTISGLPHHFHETIDNFALACQKFGVSYFNQDVVSKVKELHPYFAFIITMHKYQHGDPFELEWLNDDPYSLKIGLIKKFDNISKTVKEAVKSSNDKHILKKYIHHFI